MLDSFLSLCAQLPSTANGVYPSLLFIFTLAGFLGGFGHCVFMCGPFVLMQVQKRLAHTPIEQTSEFTRLKGAALVPYHLGRITTYTLLGALAGWSGGALHHTWYIFLAILMFITGLLLITSPFATPRLQSGLNVTPLLKNHTKNVVKNLFAKPTGFNGYLLGILLGFLPCSMVYAALAGATVTGSPLWGATLLFLLGVSTFPALFAVALFGHILHGQFRHKVLAFHRIFSLAAGMWICIVAARIIFLPH